MAKKGKSRHIPTKWGVGIFVVVLSLFLSIVIVSQTNQQTNVAIHASTGSQLSLSETQKMQLLNSWKTPDATAPSSPPYRVTISNPASQCFDDRNYGTTSNNPVQVWWCKYNDAAQIWSVGYGNGTIHIYNHCLGVVNNGTIINPKLVLVLKSCNDYNRTVWSWGSPWGFPMIWSRNIYQANGNPYCIGPSGPNIAPNGTQLILTDCTGYQSMQFAVHRY